MPHSREFGIYAMTIARDHSTMNVITTSRGISIRNTIESDHHASRKLDRSERDSNSKSAISISDRTRERIAFSMISWLQNARDNRRETFGVPRLLNNIRSYILLFLLCSFVCSGDKGRVYRVTRRSQGTPLHLRRVKRVRISINMQQRSSMRRIRARCVHKARPEDSSSKMHRHRAVVKRFARRLNRAKLPRAANQVHLPFHQSYVHVYRLLRNNGHLHPIL